MRADDLQGRQIGRYQITGVLGRGGMASVYSATDSILQREIALKVLYPQYLNDEDQIARFKREAVVAAGLDHPNIVQIYDIGEDQGSVFIAMQRLAGRAFSDVLRERGRMPPGELAPIIDQIASALGYAHARGIIHRDIKPANILIDDHGRAVLTDFGIAKLLDTPGMTRTSVMVGTPDYMAPEQIGTQPIDGRADIYAMGIMIFRALTGHRPFEGGTDEVLLGHLNGSIPPVRSYVPELPPEIDHVIRMATARRPEQRYQHAGDLAADLRAAAQLPPALGVAMAQAAQHAAPADIPTAVGLVRPTPQPLHQSTTSTAPPAAFERGALATHMQPMPITGARREAPPPPPQRRSPLWAVGAVALLAMATGGGYMAANILGKGNTSQASVAQPPTAASAASAATPTNLPTSAPSVAPVLVATAAAPSATPEVAAAPTVAPTEVPATPTRKPAATKLPATPAPPTPTQLLPTAVTPPATATPPTPSATPAPSATPTPSTTAVPVINGFGAIYADERIQKRLGAAQAPETGNLGAEQPFEHGSMIWTGDKVKDRFVAYVFLDDGRWIGFIDTEVTGPDEAPTDLTPEGKVRPVSTFGKIWDTHAEIRDQLGWGTKAEYNTDAAFQGFEHGSMLYSEKGLGKGPSIYVLYDNGKYERLADPTK